MPAMPITRRGFLAASTALGLGLGLSVVPPVAAGTNAFGGLAFGGTWRVSGGEDLHENELRAPIQAILATIDRDMSPWRSDSAVSRFNTSRHTGWHSASEGLCTVVSESLTISQLTEGAFDPTIGPAVARFGYGPITEGGGSIADLELGNGQIGKADPRLTLDLCGIAKGYALDRIIALLRAREVTNALVELGGEITALGTHPDGRPWQVAIESPQVGAPSAQRIITPGDHALATSGHSQNGYRGRIMLSHLIDPESHRPADNGLAAVSVLAPTAMRADALATALSVMGPHRGPRFAEREGIAALFLTDGQTGFTEIMTGTFADHVVA